MKHLKLLIATCALITAACSHSVEDAANESAIEQTTSTSTQKTKETQKQTTITPTYSNPLPDPMVPIVAHSTKNEDNVEIFQQKQSHYGTLKNADAPPTQTELTASPEPTSLPQETIITPPSSDF